MAWSEDLEPHASGANGLSGIVRHEAAETELFHSGQVKTVQQAAVRLACVSLVAKSHPEHRPGQGQEAERVDLAELLQLIQIGTMAPWAEDPAEASGSELPRRLQFGQGGDDDIALAGDCLAHGFTFRFTQQQLQHGRRPVRRRPFRPDRAARNRGGCS